LAVAVSLGEVPMLPEELLEELLPGISGALFKEDNVRKKETMLSTRDSGTGYTGFACF
jgi:hypothetical protein